MRMGGGIHNHLCCECTCLNVDDRVGREYIHKQQPTTRTSKTASILRNRWKDELYLWSEYRLAVLMTSPARTQSMIRMANRSSSSNESGMTDGDAGGSSVDAAATTALVIFRGLIAAKNVS